MESEQVIVAELREIQAELRHLSKQWGDTLAHQGEIHNMQHQQHEKRLCAIEAQVRANEKKLIAYTAIGGAAVLAAGFFVRLL